MNGMDDYLWLVMSLVKILGAFGTGYGGYLAYKYLDNRKSERFVHAETLQRANVEVDKGKASEAIDLFKRALREIDFDLSVHSRKETRIDLIDKREYVLSKLDKLGERTLAASELKNTDELRRSLRKSR